MMKQGKKQQNYAVVLITKYFVTFCRLLTLTYRWVRKMIKLREARYCNLKLLLIFLVIYGHTIETQIWHNTVLMTQYKFIYLVHMPLFAFLSGLYNRLPFLHSTIKTIIADIYCFANYSFLIQKRNLETGNSLLAFMVSAQLRLLDWYYLVVVLFCKRQRKYYNTYVGVIHWECCRIYKYHRS